MSITKLAVEGWKLRFSFPVVSSWQKVPVAWTKRRVQKVSVPWVNLFTKGLCPFINSVTKWLCPLRKSRDTTDSVFWVSFETKGFCPLSKFCDTTDSVLELAPYLSLEQVPWQNKRVASLELVKIDLSRKCFSERKKTIKEKHFFCLDWRAPTWWGGTSRGTGCQTFPSHTPSR